MQISVNKSFIFVKLSTNQKQLQINKMCPKDNACMSFFKS